MISACHLVRSIVLNNHSRLYKIRGRHMVFGEEILFRHDRRGNLIIRIDGQEVHAGDLQGPARALYDLLDFHIVSHAYIKNDDVEVRTFHADAWHNGLNDKLKSAFEALAGRPLAKAA
jgi:hypothetical protein